MRYSQSSGEGARVALRARCLIGLMGLALLGFLLGGDPADYVTSRAAAGTDGESSEWMFDKGLYTNSEKTGQRVRQYEDHKAPYRDPNAIYNSAHGPYPFVSNFYDPYRYYGHRPYGPNGGANPLGPLPALRPQFARLQPLSVLLIGAGTDRVASFIGPIAAGGSRRLACATLRAFVVCLAPRNRRLPPAASTRARFLQSVHDPSRMPSSARAWLECADDNIPVHCGEKRCSTRDMRFRL